MKARKYLYVFGPVEKCWTSWYYYGTEAEARKWLLREGVPSTELDGWIYKADKFERVTN